MIDGEKMNDLYETKISYARDGEPSFALTGCKIVLKATRSYGIL